MQRKESIELLVQWTRCAGRHLFAAVDDRGDHPLEGVIVVAAVRVSQVDDVAGRVFEAAGERALLAVARALFEDNDALADISSTVNLP